VAKKVEWIRHGDVALIRIPDPADARRVDNEGKRLVLAEGEVTGHAHVLEGDIKFDTEREPHFITVRGKAVLTHQEHATVEVPEGTWMIVRQREYWGEQQGIRQVMD